MIFDSNGLPKDNGASDFQDSSRLAGILAVFGWPQEICLEWYCLGSLQGGWFCYCRHPKEFIYDFSRDQAVCLMAGLWAQQRPWLVDQKAISGRDLIPPSVKGHIKRCKGVKASWFDDLWLWGEIITHAKITPLGEPNQLLCMLLVHPNKLFLRKWCKWNPNWRESIYSYWRDSYRNEPELADFMVTKVLTELG